MLAFSLCPNEGTESAKRLPAILSDYFIIPLASQKCNPEKLAPLADGAKKI